MEKDNMKEYSYRVYLAGPFFNEEQIERINYLEDTLDKLGFNVFSPRQASLIKPNCTKEDMITTFAGNISHIDNCDFMLAVLDGNDAGTHFETGYAYSVNKPVLYFNETREKGPNLMLAMSGGLPFITKTTKLSDLLKEVGADATEPRVVLETILNRIIIDGLYEVRENTKNPFDEVE